jgi:hypothetical protein
MRFTLDMWGGEPDDIATALWAVQSDIEDEGQTSGSLVVNGRRTEWRISENE